MYFQIGNGKMFVQGSCRVRNSPTKPSPTTSLEKKGCSLGTTVVPYAEHAASIRKSIEKGCFKGFLSCLLRPS